VYTAFVILVDPGLHRIVYTALFKYSILRQYLLSHIASSPSGHRIIIYKLSHRSMDYYDSRCDTASSQLLSANSTFFLIKHLYPAAVQLVIAASSLSLDHKLTEDGDTRTGSTSVAVTNNYLTQSTLLVSVV